MSSSTTSETNPTTTSSPQEPPPPQPEGKKRRTLYNTFLSPSGSTSFFTFSWFESAPIKKSTKKLASEMGLASSDPSASSSSSSNLPPGATTPLRRRPTYEEYRSEEPPQARLIRLRGLFDVLMDKDQHDALADGRAKEAWRATARTARYGAGGNLARGSLAKEMHIDRHMSNKEFELDADNSVSKNATSAASATSPSSSSSSSSSSSPAQPSPPRQSYAKELLTQCRQCRLDLESERTKRSKSAASGDSSPSSKGPQGDTSSDPSASSWYNVWPFNGSDDSAASSKTDSTSAEQNSTLSSMWYSIAGSPQCKDERELEADYDGESGYTGSGVWGLSAVKGGTRDRERQRLRDEQQQQPPVPESEEEDGHQRTMIEWEGFLKYAELKERELYKIFAELDRNCDMRLDVAEIRTALDKAGIDLPPALLDDFIASLSSSTHTADPHARGRGVDLWHNPRELQPTQYISWPEFRDYLLLLPRKPSVGEIFKFYQVRKAFGLFGIGGIFSEFGSKWGSDRHSATSVTSDGDVSFGAEETKSKGGAEQSKKTSATAGKDDSATQKQQDQQKESASTAGVTTGGDDGNKGDDNQKKGSAAGGAGAGVATGSSSSSSSPSSGTPSSASDRSDSQDSHTDGLGPEEEEEEDNDMIHSDVALKFLLAGGIAGAVSRTATAPFDRLKIYLITASRSDETATSKAIETVKKSGASGASKEAGKLASRSMGMLGTAVQTLYREGGGLKAFWLGNGLNCMKIFPESAIKFLSYETSKRAFAKYVDHVSDSRDISGTSRFISGGVGGITSQLAIYPVETLKTRLMSSQGTNAPLSASGQRLVGNELLFATAKQMWTNGGVRIYYRGLVAGLVGVFPYSAIDMSTFEGIKLAYISYTGKEDPGTLALLSFGSISGSVGATTVYPLNLIRTRLQASGTPSHPIIYKGFMDAVLKTYQKEGIVGFYRGLIPTLAKVVPAVSISYVCYENSKKRLGVA